ncbi:tyrosine-type recombinase/integrase [Xanthobacter oligotrophicus]|uniref:tyrosine-type recombinase/integrase n=1 Tax=Xanthobacter oligotrophicus TaxID=2607286 RepID=UPI0011F361DF|nr:site-specific integrase [Xanthobacter oligotrophicus]
MGRETKRLTARTVATLTKPGRHADGGNLYLSISANGGRRWIFLYRWDGKQLEMGLGSARDVPLARARELADAARAQLAEGISPLSIRRNEQVIPTFGEAADALVDDIASGFRNEKHIEQWRMTLKEYAAPLRDKSVADITTEDVLAVLKPLWQAKQETASRLRGRIERVLDAAKAKGNRSGENPARWRGHLDALLPKRQKLQRGHHAAMPYSDVPAFVKRLRSLSGSTSLALEFLILAAARTGEVRGATWAEIDLDAKVWTVPAARMKAGKVHRVPLTVAALDVLTRAMDLQPKPEGAAFLFPGGKPGKPLSVMALDMQMRRLKSEVTVHGFRSSFRDWAGEETSFPREVAEAALAHTVGDATERAYRRADALEKRRKLMEAWASFVGGGDGAKVVPLRPQAQG